jgi:hypothetical protein
MEVGECKEPGKTKCKEPGKTKCKEPGKTRCSGSLAHDTRMKMENGNHKAETGE